MFILAILVFLVYGNACFFDFIEYDDNVYVTRNSQVLKGITLENLRWAFTTDYAGFWHPLTWISHMLDIQIYGLWGGGHHLTNILLHLASSWVLFFVFNQMTGSIWRSGFIAALFALHPLHVESVAWIAERKDILSAFFWNLTLWAYLIYVKNPRISRYGLILLFFGLGLMAKPMLATLPLVLLLLDFWPLGRSSGRLNRIKIKPLSGNLTALQRGIPLRQLILEKIPLVLLVIPISLVTFSAQRRFGAIPSWDTFPLDVRIVNALISYGQYLLKMIVPLHLSAIYPHPGTWPMGQVILSGLLLLLISTIVLMKTKSYPYLGLGWLWYLVTLLPVIGLIQIARHAMADRYTYLPLTGLFIIIAWGVPDLLGNIRNRKVILGVASGLILLVLSGLAWQRCQLWGDKVAFWNDVLKNNNRVPYAHLVNGLDNLRKRRYPEAIKNFTLALALDRNFFEALFHRAEAYNALGQVDRAIDDFTRAIKIKPGFAEPYYNRGIRFLQGGPIDRAIADFTEAVRLDPKMADGYNNRGVAYALKGERDRAIADFSQALELNSRLIDAYQNRGTLFQNNRQYDLAMADFDRILQIQPDHPLAYYQLGLALRGKGRGEEAIAYFQKALTIRPDYAEASRELKSLLKKREKSLR